MKNNKCDEKEKKEHFKQDNKNKKPQGKPLEDLKKQEEFYRKSKHDEKKQQDKGKKHIEEFEEDEYEEYDDYDDEDEDYLDED